MPSAIDRIDIGPPRDAGAIRSFGLALLIHAALIIALTWGVNWKRSDSVATFGAELWSDRSLDAAPIQTPPQEALPLPPPVAKPPVVQAPPEPTPNVDIALEQEKKRKLLKDQQIAQEKAEQAKAKLLQAQADKAQQLKAEQLAKAEQAKVDALKARQSQQSADKQRDENLEQIRKIIDKASGSPQGDSTSRATAGGKGSSTTYGAIARAAIMPNVVLTEAIDGNPMTLVEVRVTSDGTITSSKVVQSSGNKNWDNAALNAVRRTGVMPKDVDGKVPDTFFVVSIRPHL